MARGHNARLSLTSTLRHGFFTSCFPAAAGFSVSGPSQTLTTVQLSERFCNTMSYWASAEPSSKFTRSEEHTSELQSRPHLVCRLLLEKKKTDLSEFQGQAPSPRGACRLCSPLQLH